MRSLQRLLGLSERPSPLSPDERDTATVRRIAAELDRMEPERARFLASFAYVLARVAHADAEVSEEEVREMERWVRELGGLAEAQATLVVQIAKTQKSGPYTNASRLISRANSRWVSLVRKLR